MVRDKLERFIVLTGYLNNVVGLMNRWTYKLPLGTELICMCTGLTVCLIHYHEHSLTDYLESVVYTVDVNFTLHKRKRRPAFFRVCVCLCVHSLCISCIKNGLDSGTPEVTLIQASKT